MLRTKIEIALSPQACILLTAFLLTVPMPWVGAWIAAALVHELGHIGALRLFCIPIYKLEIGCLGAKILTAPLTPMQNIVCGLSGPLSGAMLLFLAQKLPRTAICALVQTTTNLLPLASLDGGRALEGLSACFLSEKNVHRVCTGAEWMTILAVAGIGLFLAGYQNMTFPLLLYPVLLMIRCRIAKRPCK